MCPSGVTSGPGVPSWIQKCFKEFPMWRHRQKAGEPQTMAYPNSLPQITGQQFKKGKNYQQKVISVDHRSESVNMAQLHAVLWAAFAPPVQDKVREANSIDGFEQIQFGY